MNMYISDTKPCKIFIEGNEFEGIPNFESLDNDMTNYACDHINLNQSNEGSLRFIYPMNKFLFYILIGFYDWVVDNCPNKKSRSFY